MPRKPECKAEVTVIVKTDVGSNPSNTSKSSENTPKRGRPVGSKNKPKEPTSYVVTREVTTKETFEIKAGADRK